MWYMRISCLYFFFSSRRRHTRFKCDWSSDVCSSDLRLFQAREKTEDSNNSSFSSPLDPMNREERLIADFRGTGLTLGHHPMAYHRSYLNRQGIMPSSKLPSLHNVTFVSVAGAVIVRQRSGTAKRSAFVSRHVE